MKKRMSLVAVSIFVCLLMTGADFRMGAESANHPKRKCGGYVIIEAGKGIDCNGDTIRLIRTQGYYEFTSL